MSDKVILCEFDGQLYRCKGKGDPDKQMNCEGFTPSFRKNTCYHYKNSSFDHICYSDEMKGKIKK